METLEKNGNREPECGDSGVETILDDIIDLEEYAKLGKRPPLAKGYRLKINGGVIRRPRCDAGWAGDADPCGFAAGERVHASSQVRRRTAAQGGARRKG